MAGLQLKYFVLNPTKNDAFGEASRAAMDTFAATIRSTNPQLAADISSWVGSIENLLYTGGNLNGKEETK